jgi:hypothetical protein
MNFLFIDRVGPFEHLIIIKTYYLMEVGGAKREESAPLPSQQQSHHSRSSYRNPLSNSSFTATADVATEIPSFQQQSHTQQ